MIWGCGGHPTGSGLRKIETLNLFSDFKLFYPLRYICPKAKVSPVFKTGKVKQSINVRRGSQLEVQAIPQPGFFLALQIMG